MDIRKSKYDSNFLNLDTLEPRTSYKKVAYIKNIEYSSSEIAGIFVRVTLMDCKNRILVGRIFNVESREIDDMVESLREKLAIITFEYDKKGTKRNATITEAKILTNDVVTIEEFVEKIDNYDVELEKLDKQLSGIKNPSYSKLIEILNAGNFIKEVYKGIIQDVFRNKVGGKLKYCNTAFEMINMLISDEEKERAKIIFLIVLCCKDKRNVVTNFRRSEDLTRIVKTISDLLLGDEIMNFYFSRLKVEQPLTLLNKQLVDIDKVIYEVERINDIRYNLPKGGYKYVEEGKNENFSFYYNF